MSDAPCILSYEHVSEPEIRLRRAAMGAALLALEAALLLIYKYGSGPFFSGLWDANMLTGIWSAGASTAVYSLLSICVPAGVWFLAGAKLPRLQAGRVVGLGPRRAAMGLALAYSALRIGGGAFRIWAIGSGTFVGSSDFRMQMAWACDAASPLALLGLLVAAWFYMADLGARVRRGSYLTLATAGLGVSLVIAAAMFVGRIEMFIGPLYPAEVRAGIGRVGSDVLLCAVQMVYWGVTATMLRNERGAG